MRRVILESPYAASEHGTVDDHVAYARRCMLDSLRRGEAPMVSHLLYTQCLDDLQPDERHMGIEAGLSWGPVASATVVYTDFGVSSGMRRGIERAIAEGRLVELRRIGEP